ncbi:MAG: hypothetical protein ACKO3V_01715, partial [Pirellula sp.]
MQALYQKPNSEDDSLATSPDGLEAKDLVDSFSEVIDDEASWLKDVGAQYRIRKYLFGGQLKSVEDFQGWDGSEYESNIQGALESLKTRTATRPPAAIVLITDGRSTNSIGFQDTDQVLSDSKTPIFPVMIPPQGDQRRDLWIQDVS